MCAIHSTKETTTAESPSANTRVLRHSQIGKWSRTINTARLRSEKLNMRCTCCLFMLTLWSAAAGCNNRMPMCIGSFSLHSKWIGLSKRDPNSSVLRRDVESDRLIGNSTSLTAGKLVPLPIPCRPWSHVGVDFVNPPKSEGYTCILAAVGRFSKASNLIPLLLTAEALFHNLFRTFGIPEDVISYRGPQFVSCVWKTPVLHCLQALLFPLDPLEKEKNIITQISP